MQTPHARSAPTTPELEPRAPRDRHHVFAAAGPRRMHSPVRPRAVLATPRSPSELHGDARRASSIAPPIPTSGRHLQSICERGRGTCEAAARPPSSIRAPQGRCPPRFAAPPRIEFDRGRMRPGTKAPTSRGSVHGARPFTARSEFWNSAGMRLRLRRQAYALLCRCIADRRAARGWQIRSFPGLPGRVKQRLPWRRDSGLRISATLSSTRLTKRTLAAWARLTRFPRFR